MSEYWVSTVSCLRTPVCPFKCMLTESKPKYWCKNCKLFVRDTPLEKANHKATPRHQGNLKRFLRDLHRENEKGERDKQRAKAEVERLNRITGSSVTPSTVAGLSKPQGKTLKSATPEERNRQMTQLAAMGVAVPQEFRRENAMAGEWETISRKVIAPGAEDEGKIEIKPGLNVGVRKRKLEDGDEEEIKADQQRRRPKWGTDLKTISGDDDLEALLNTTITTKKPTKKEEDGVTKAEGDVSGASNSNENGADVKHEGEGVNNIHTIPSQDEAAHAVVKEENEEPDVGSMFKKRKSKAKRSG